MIRLLVTGAGGSAAANFCDALRRSAREYELVGVDTDPVMLHLAPMAKRAMVPRFDRADYIEVLSSICSEYRVDLVHPQPDVEVRVIAAHREDLPAQTFLPSDEALRIARDKYEFAVTMQRQGIAVPDTAALDDPNTIEGTVANMLTRHPKVWVRAKVGAGSRAALPVTSTAQAMAWIRWWEEEKGLRTSDFMVSEFLPGAEFAYQSLWQDGELIAGQTRERVEYLYGHLTPSGQTSTPSVARTVARPDVDALAQDAVRSLDALASGVFCIDIKEDRSGVPKVTEINAGRFFTTSNFFAAAGLNMPDMYVRVAMGESVERLGSSPLEPDIYWIRMVDMGYVLVHGDEIDAWPKSDR